MQPGCLTGTGHDQTLSRSRLVKPRWPLHRTEFLATGTGGGSSDEGL
jgi:hypothetical protein